MDPRTEKRGARAYRLYASTAVVVVALAALALWAVGLQRAAAEGRAEAKAGAAAFAAGDLDAAASRFRSARDAFARAERLLGPEGVAAAVSRLPWAGRQYAAARGLVGIGRHASVAGLEIATAAKPAAEGGGLNALAGPGRRHVRAGIDALALAAVGIDRLPAEEGLVRPLGRAVRDIRATAAGAAPFLGRAEALADLQSFLFSGKRRRLLVVSQDGAELRPTGGFAGSFGIVTIDDAGVKLERYEDVYVLPDPPGVVKPPPGTTMTKDFSFRDANWWLDFPTSARTMLRFWKDCGQEPVDGVVAIDTVAMQELLAATGPIRVDSYGETFTSENLLERLLYLVEIRIQPDGEKKGVLTALAGELEKRVLASEPREIGKAALALGKAADAKHVQLFFPDAGAQRAARELGWSGAVDPGPEATDLLAVSNAMNKGGKVNIAMRKTISYAAALRADGSADTTLVLAYTNTGPYPSSWRMPNLFRDWLRVYRLPGTRFPARTPAGSETVTLTDFGFPAEVRTFELPRGASRTETLTAEVPKALRAAPGPTRRYRLHVVRQNELTDLPLRVVVRAPAGWRVRNAHAALAASGRPLPVRVDDGAARMELPLAGDFYLEVMVAK